MFVMASRSLEIISTIWSLRYAMQCKYVHPFECVPMHTFWTEPTKYWDEHVLMSRFFIDGTNQFGNRDSMSRNWFSKDFHRNRWKWLVNIKWVCLLAYVAQFAFIACKHVRYSGKNMFRLTSSVMNLVPWNWIFLRPPIEKKIDAS